MYSMFQAALQVTINTAACSRLFAYLLCMYVHMYVYLDSAVIMTCTYITLDWGLDHLTLDS